MVEINEAVFVLINQFAKLNVHVDGAVIMLAQLPPYICMGMMAYYWFSDGFKQRIASILAGFSVLIGMCLSYLIGVMFYQDRPFVNDMGTQLIAHAADNSFPSDHTTFIFSISMIFLLCKQTRKGGAILFSLCFLGGFARVFVGVHYPFDIVGGMLVAAIASLLAYRIRGNVSRFLNWMYSVAPDWVVPVNRG